MRVQVAPRQTNEDPTCVYCRGVVSGDEALFVCPACRATFHEDCRSESSRCPTPGCAGLGPLAPPRDDAARRARLDAARARREAEDRDRAARASRLAPPMPTWSPVRRIRSASELGLVLLCGGMVGLIVGWCGAKLEPLQAGLWLWGSVLTGTLEALTVGVLGIRSQPLVRVRWTSGEGYTRTVHRDAVPVVILVVLLAPVLGYLLGQHLGWPVTAAVASALAALPLALRFLGWAEEQQG